MSKTPNRERRGSREEQGWDTLHAVPAGNRDPQRRESRGGPENPPAFSSYSWKKRGEGATQGDSAAGLDRLPVSLTAITLCRVRCYFVCIIYIFLETLAR